MWLQVSRPCCSLATIRGRKTDSLPSLCLFLLKIYCSCCPGVSGALNIDSTELHGGRVKRGFITWQDISIQTKAKSLKTQHLKCPSYLQVSGERHAPCDGNKLKSIVH
uniref:Uncharacterized protein n=1 Tax=Molossus molossus TaxID=27622 RepID=A0A7J8C943_MOLMO|nr:hypothetical protein HJG59_009974 [Molossus molossus]